MCPPSALEFHWIFPSAMSRLFCGAAVSLSALFSMHKMREPLLSDSPVSTLSIRKSMPEYLYSFPSLKNNKTVKICSGGLSETWRHSRARPARNLCLIRGREKKAAKESPACCRMELCLKRCSLLIDSRPVLMYLWYMVPCHPPWRSRCVCHYFLHTRCPKNRWLGPR